MNEENLTEEDALKLVSEYTDLEQLKTIEKTEAVVGDTRLPDILAGWVKEATNVSHYNDIPAVMSALVLIGQMSKDFVKIPVKASLVDTRVHFIWIQTSGTGKSELMNFFMPVSEGLWKKINAFNSYREHSAIGAEELLEQYDNFDIVEYTDASLIGYQKEIVASEDDEMAGIQQGDIIFEAVKGSLDGHGLARWDEFTNSGVFDKSQYKASIVTYLNTMMNAIGGSSQVITKKLKEGPKVSCHSERSVIATTFPPPHLDEKITETGLFQRATLYIWEVPEHIKDEIDDMVTENFGVFEDINLPIEKYTDQFFEIYKLTKARYSETGEKGKEDPVKTIRYSQDFREAMRLRKFDLRDMVNAEDGKIRDTARTFMTRLLIMMGKIAVLCCIAESKDIKDKNKRFIVNSRNVNQSAFIIRNCYKSLISWFVQSLRVRHADIAKSTKYGGEFVKVYTELHQKSKNEERWVSKNLLFEKYMTEHEISLPQTYNRWKECQQYFEHTKKGRTALIRLKLEGERK